MAGTTAGRSFGSVYAATEELKDSAGALFVAYENDEPVAVLAQKAMEIRISAAHLESTLDAIGGALDNLG